MSLIVVYLPRMTAAMRVCVCTVGYLSHSQIAFEINEAIDRELSVSVSVRTALIVTILERRILRQPIFGRDVDMGTRRGRRRSTSKKVLGLLLYNDAQLCYALGHCTRMSDVYNCRLYHTRVKYHTISAQV